MIEQSKINIWTILLLVWNGALLAITIFFLWKINMAKLTPNDVAAACASATTQVLIEDSKK